MQGHGSRVPANERHQPTEATPEGADTEQQRVSSFSDLESLLEDGVCGPSQAARCRCLGSRLLQRGSHPSHQSHGLTCHRVKRDDPGLCRES